MSEKLPVISGKDFIKLLESIGFSIIRINGSHHPFKTYRWKNYNGSCS
jgi:predicted RNA binding protein YcfA (HicA-like mRNA interferase family)